MQPPQAADGLPLQRQRDRAARDEHPVELGERGGRVVEHLDEEARRDDVERGVG
nr:hypothetical protein [Actinophytocola sp.]